MLNPSTPFDAMMQFGKFVPGFDFIQGLANNADKALPAAGQWVVPTLDPDELDKRIHDLKAVQFWLEQNSRMVAATIQALEVQKMTLGALKTMNVKLADLASALQTPTGDAAQADPTSTSSTPSPEVAADQASPPPSAPGGGPVDATRWWGALTEQFGHLARAAVTPPQTTAKAKKPAGSRTTKAPAKSSAKPASKAKVKAKSPSGSKAPSAAQRKAASSAK